LADLQGPKLRLGRFKDVEIAVKPGHKMRFDLDPTPGDETRVQMPHPEIFKALRKGMLLFWTTAGCGCVSTSGPTTGPM
jgi:pyruvate kinase